MKHNLIIVSLAGALAVGCGSPAPFADNPDAPDTGAVIIGEEPEATDADEFYRTDDQLRTEVQAVLRDAGIDEVAVHVINSDVYLDGWARSRDARDRAVSLARDVVGVEEVFGRDIAVW
ncbi:MAG: BON domain-containing protein [Xanthomonadales bacterium]|nr:BON domain-containing protein [Xanthomonadales bacterium]